MENRNGEKIILQAKFTFKVKPRIPRPSGRYSVYKLEKVIGTLAMEFNDHEELVKIKFHKINDLIPFSNQYDCEMTPDFIDGGHGIQVSQSR